MTSKFINGVNYGNTFIPESFFADHLFYSDNGIPKYDEATQNSLCDLKGDKSKEIMEKWLQSQIKEQDFKEMKDFGLDVVRLPLGYWNVLDMPGNPNAPEKEAERMGNLSKIMPSSDYRKYIDQVFDYASKYDLKILLDFHGAPGSQSGESNTGCSFKYKNRNWWEKKLNESYFYWDTEWNKQWSKKAVVELAKICQLKGDTCYGVEILNEPATPVPLPFTGINRDHLRDWYQETMLAARQEGGLDMNKPLMINEWAPHWFTYWQGNFKKWFPESEYGKTQVDIHIYDFGSSIEKEEMQWSAFDLPMVAKIAEEVPVFIGEFTLSTHGGMSDDKLQGWA